MELRRVPDCGRRHRADSYETGRLPEKKTSPLNAGLCITRCVDQMPNRPDENARARKPVSLAWRSKGLIAAGAVPGLFMAALVILRILGLIRPFQILTDPMSPTLSPGDHVMMDGISYLLRKPRRGDIIGFRGEGVRYLESSSPFMSRIVGEPGEHVWIDEGQLYIGGHRMAIHNRAGTIRYWVPPQWQGSATNTDLIVPKGEFFVLGDNSPDCLDSRYYGCIPARKLMGRMAFCYWPPRCIGAIR